MAEVSPPPSKVPTTSWARRTGMATATWLPMRTAAMTMTPSEEAVRVVGVPTSGSRASRQASSTAARR